MTLFESVKDAVTPRMAAERYGLQVGRTDIICCPFHNDQTPSMKLNQNCFYCFGCGAHGDVIELTAKLFNLPAAEAAKKLAADFGVAEERPSVLAKLKRGKTLIKNESLCFRVLRDYLQILQDWKEHCSPQSPTDEPDPRFVEACHMLECVGYMLDILTSGTPEERAEVVADMQKDSRLELLQVRVQKIKEEEHGQK